MSMQPAPIQMSIARDIPSTVERAFAYFEFVFLLLALFSFSWAAQANSRPAGMVTELKSFAVSEQKNVTAIHFKFNHPYIHHVFILPNPERLVVDLGKSANALDLQNLIHGHPLITRVRSGYDDRKNLRIVFDLSNPIRLRSLPAARELRLELEKQAAPRTLVRPSPLKMDISKAMPAGKKPPPLRVTQNLRASSRDIVVVLDPGHGGKDPGAVGPNRHAEKHVVLAIAQKLKQIIDREPGMKAVLTRDGDYYVGLRERLNIARKYNADIFISIHADAFINQHSSGASVFALSQTGATSEAARWLAEKENYSELGGVNLSGLDDQNGLVRTVLIDLSQTATITASLQMGASVLRSLDNITNLHHNAVEQARFVVLKSPDIPSILIETGFISNPREESNLTNSRYQARMTQAIFRGIKQYFMQHPPQKRTNVAAFRASAPAPTRHIVQRGESLSKIAARYHLSTARLQALNHLNSESIRVGQKLIVSAR
ncbi:N-acetylmuramoyl-L-alanine amidase [Legionella sp. 27cVA30]|nr:MULTISPECIES: N-acetylmuramoyl-L-alanine amidase [Legionella]MCP0914576.1 N-acetylmuramoyl-L-alanine amidase [Legionella sp. 27cVA30]